MHAKSCILNFEFTYPSRQTCPARVGLSCCLLPCPKCHDFKFLSDCHFHECFHVSAIPLLYMLDLPRCLFLPGECIHGVEE